MVDRVGPELRALRGLRWLDRVLYQELRARADWVSGEIGGGLSITWRRLARDVYVEPGPNIQGAGEPSSYLLRRAFDRLRASGLVVSPDQAGHRLALPIQLPFARQNGRRNAPDNPQGNPAGNPSENPQGVPHPGNPHSDAGLPGVGVGESLSFSAGDSVGGSFQPAQGNPAGNPSENSQGVPHPGNPHSDAGLPGGGVGESLSFSAGDSAGESLSTKRHSKTTPPHQHAREQRRAIPTDHQELARIQVEFDHHATLAGWNSTQRAYQWQEFLDRNQSSGWVSADWKSEARRFIRNGGIKDGQQQTASSGRPGTESTVARVIRHSAESIAREVDAGRHSANLD